jgi:NAD(P)H-flavin reductase
VVERHGDWREHDVFVCGSPDMTRSTLTRLSELGVPESRISYDVAGDEHPASAQVIDLRRTRQSRERASTGWDR